MSLKRSMDNLNKWFLISLVSLSVCLSGCVPTLDQTGNRNAGTGGTRTASGVLPAEKIHTVIDEEIDFVCGDLNVAITEYDEANTWGRAFILQVENAGSRPLRIATQEDFCSVNGFSNRAQVTQSDPYSDEYIKRGETQEFLVILNESDLRYAGIDVVGTVDLSFIAKDRDYNTNGVSDLISIETSDAEKADKRDLSTSELIHEADGLKVYYLGCSDNGSIKEFAFCLDNSSEKDIYWGVSGLRFDQIMEEDAFEYGGNRLAPAGVKSLLVHLQLEADIRYPNSKYSNLSGKLEWLYDASADEYGSYGQFEHSHPFEIHPDFENPLW